MIAISEELKNTFKSKNREIKGYVEILYDIQNLDSDISSDMVYNDNFLYADITNGERVTQKYATLEKDFLLLDGSFVLPSKEKNNSNSGIISTDTFENLTKENKNHVQIDFNKSQKIRYLSIYTTNNIIKKFNLSINYSANNYEFYNDKEVINIDLGSYVDANDIFISINEVENVNKRVRISHIDFGYSEAYYGNDLVSFTIDEEINNMLESTPINECSITLGNYDSKFDILNPDGLQKMFNDKTLIIPHIGAITENNGIEYVKMGEYYFYEFRNNNDYTVTLIARNIMEQLSKESFVYTKLGQDPFLAYMKTNELSNNIPIIYPDYKFKFTFDEKFNNKNYVMSRYFSSKENYLSYFLLECSIGYNDLFYVDRNSVVTLRPRYEESMEKITYDEISEDLLSIEDLGEISEIEVTRHYMGEYTEPSNPTIEKITTSSIKLAKNEIILPISVDSHIFSDNVKVSYSGCSSAQIVAFSARTAYVKIVGSIGSDASITLFDRRITTNEYDVKWNIKNDKSSNSKICLSVDIICSKIPFETLLKNTSRYNYSFDYNGLPYLEAGDVIEIETDYGMKKITIEKNHFEYDGGLLGKIEGCGN